MSKTDIRDAKFMSKGEEQSEETRKEMDMLMTIQPVWKPAEELVEKENLSSPLGLDRTRWDIAQKASNGEVQTAVKRPMARHGTPAH